MTDKLKECAICGEPFTEYGNNPEPFKGEYACDDCDAQFVIPARMCLGRAFADENLLTLLQTFAELGKVMRQINKRPKLRVVENETKSN